MTLAIVIVIILVTIIALGFFIVGCAALAEGRPADESDRTYVTQKKVSDV